MRQLIAFIHVSLDGFYADANGDMSWAKRDDPEFNAFTDANATAGGMLVFGRVTYDLMASFWPTPQAQQMMPVVAERMNNLEKIVFSRTLNEASWNNTRVLNGDLATEVRNLKGQSGAGMVILGSGEIVTQLTQVGLIDEIQVVVNPILLGSGKRLFDGVEGKLPLKLTSSRVFRNGLVYLCYQPAG